MSPGCVVWEDMLESTLRTVLDGGRRDEFPLSFLLNSEHRVLFFNQGMQNSRSEDQFAVL